MRSLALLAACGLSLAACTAFTGPDNPLPVEITPEQQMCLLERGITAATMDAIDMTGAIAALADCGVLLPIPAP